MNIMKKGKKKYIYTTLEIYDTYLKTFSKLSRFIKLSIIFNIFDIPWNSPEFYNVPWNFLNIQ